MEHPEEREPSEVITSDTENATTIQPSEAPKGKREKFKRFRAYNTGTWNGPKRENKEVTHRQDDLHRYDSISSSLSLSEHQKEVGRGIVDEIDITTKKIGVDSILFGICVIVANADVENGSRYHPHPKAANDELFRNMAETIGIDRNQQTSAIEKVRSRVDL